MWTIKGIVDVYMIVFLHIGTRRMWISPCTVHPNAGWVKQQARNFLMHAEDIGLSPGYGIPPNYTELLSSENAGDAGEVATGRSPVPVWWNS
ncbi:MAG: hypothetical protein DWQ34_16220 [Planctomycetota bacterium]|nr:MAG: hypothetical protein DWQ34_16220 [Planctomycetota bacterium]